MGMLALVISLVWSLISFGAELSSDPTLSDLNDCNWIVNYRGTSYDLTPLTREALARPIENDLRYALRRVPAAAKHLDSMQNHLQEARMSTFLASGFLGGFLVAKILSSSAKAEHSKDDYNMAMLASGAFFLRATFESWTSTRSAKHELIESLAAFNKESPYKITPHSDPAEPGAP